MPQTVHSLNNSMSNKSHLHPHPSGLVKPICQLPGISYI